MRESRCPRRPYLLFGSREPRLQPLLRKPPFLARLWPILPSESPGHGRAPLTVFYYHSVRR